MAYEDVPHRDKTYRIISEEPNLAHPEHFIVAAFDLEGSPPQKIYEYKAQKSDHAWMMEDARKAIAKR